MFFFVDVSVSLIGIYIVWVGGVLHLYWERHGTSFRVQAPMLLLVVGLEVAGPSFTKGLLFPEFILKVFSLPETTSWHLKMDG